MASEKNIGEHPCVKNIRARFSKKLPPEETNYLLVDLIEDTAIEVDYIVRELLGDPGILEHYNYDGKFFDRKNGNGWSRMFNGDAILHSMAALADYFLEQTYKTRKKMIEELLKNHLFEARVRLLHWQEYRSLQMVPPEVIKEIAEMHKRAMVELTPISESQKEFFKSYEDQLKTRD